jgi:hypothetical protein
MVWASGKVSLGGGGGFLLSLVLPRFCRYRLEKLAKSFGAVEVRHRLDARSLFAAYAVAYEFRHGQAQAGRPREG